MKRTDSKAPMPEVSRVATSSASLSYDAAKARMKQLTPSERARLQKLMKVSQANAQREAVAQARRKDPFATGESA